MNLIEISQQLLNASKSTNSVTSLLNQLEIITLPQLEICLDTDDKRKAFWINIYNAFATIYLKTDSKIILNPIKRKIFFSKKRIQISKCIFSLDDVEHQILRKSKHWWRRGYIPNPINKPCFKRLSVQELDPRIHFALNCGAKGCPPIRHYDYKSIDEQLDLATRAFLYSETKENETKNQVQISKLFSWYKSDFGGENGIISFLKKYDAIKITTTPKIVYSDYNWEPWIK